FLATAEDLNDWLDSSNANVTYLGNDWGSPRSLEEVRFIACSERTSGGTCGGRCYAFRGLQNGQCIPLPGGRTATCLAATADVGGCSDRQCTINDCFAYATCKSPLDHRFCDVEEISSIDTQN
ncbi:hypothetical protein BKA70DRAFT_1055976, partial [Coprinopsis sp. MPI-PUGE-AT-0042]